VHNGQLNHMGEAPLRSFDYFEKMGREGRTIVIDQYGKLVAYMTFSICNDYLPYAQKELWEYMAHNPNGKICFVEKMACLKWSRQVLREIEIAIVNKYPQVECAIWYRPGRINQRKVIYRRRYYEASLRN